MLHRVHRCHCCGSSRLISYMVDGRRLVQCKRCGQLTQARRSIGDAHSLVLGDAGLAPALGFKKKIASDLKKELDALTGEW